MILTLTHLLLFFFFFNDPATTEISPLPLHDALPISPHPPSPDSEFFRHVSVDPDMPPYPPSVHPLRTGHEGRRCREDRKSTRLNSSHGYISYAVFCLKKKKSLES